MSYISRHEKRASKSKRDIKAAFVQLIIEYNDANSITVSEILHQADYNRSTFYYHYQNKYDLVEDLFIDAVKGLKNALDMPFRKSKLEDMKKIPPSSVLMLVLEHIEKNKELFMALDIIKDRNSIYDRMMEFYRNIFTKNFKYIQHEQKSEINYELFVSWQAYSLIGVLKYWIETNFKYSANYMFEQMILISNNPPTAIMKNL